jgi:hypothetical protein
VAPKKNKTTYNYILLATLGALIFALPWYYIYNFYHSRLDIQSKQEKIISFLRQYASHRSIYFFSTTGFIPLVNYADDDVTYASRFSFFWMLPALVKSSYVYDSNHLKQQKIIDKNFLIDMIAEDLNKNRPDLVFVDVNQLKQYLFFYKKYQGQYRVEPIPFDYLKYFLENEKFKAAWKSYHLLGNLKKVSSFYQFDVYERANSDHLKTD